MDSDVPPKKDTGRKPDPKKSTPWQREKWRKRYYDKKKLGAIILIVLCLSSFIPLAPVKADNVDWLSGWGYRKGCGITGSSAGTQTNYQVKVKAYYGEKDWAKELDPLLTVGVAESWDDSNINFPYPVKVGDTYYLYYSGGDGEGGTPNQRTGLATGTDGKTFTRITTGIDGSSLVLDIGTEGAWDDNYAWGASVVYDDGTFYMFYTGRDHDTYQEDIGVATSTDGIVFTKYGSNPILEHGGGGWKNYHLCHADVAWDPENDVWVMLVSGMEGAGATGHESIGRYYASDAEFPYTWHEDDGNPVIDYGEQAGIDDYHSYHPSIYPSEVDGSWYVYYTAAIQYSVTGRTLARATTDSLYDGTFTKDANNPIIGRGSSDRWDHNETLMPCNIFKINNKYALYYVGEGITGNGLGLALSYTIDGLGVRYSDEVALDENCRTDFGDVRFTRSDGVTELKYKQIEWENSEYATFYVLNPTLPADPDKTTIYVYYGDEDATSTGNGETTFPWLFDDLSDYSVDDSPNDVDWDTEGTGVGDTIDIQEDPADATKKCIRIVESGSDDTVLWALLKAERSQYALHFRLRGDTDTDAHWYFMAYEDTTIITTVTRRFSIDRFNWHDDTEYQEFSPQLSAPLDTWINVTEMLVDTGGEYLHWLVDYTDYTADLRVSPSIGVDKYKIKPNIEAQTLYIGGVGQDNRFIFARNFVDPEPIAEWDAAEDVAPQMTIANIDAEEWVFEGKKRYEFVVTFADVEIGDVDQVGLRFTDTTSEVHTVWYDKDANTLTLTSPGDGISGWLHSLEQTGHNITATFMIMFNNPIPDSYDVQAQVRLVSTLDTGWLIPLSDTFNIYNLGGLTDLTYTGYSGRRAGGDAFEIYAADALVAVLANENFELDLEGTPVYSKTPVGDPKLRLEFDSIDWVVNDAPPYLNVTIIDEYTTPNSRAYAYTGTVNTPTWRDGDQSLHIATATVSHGYPSAFKRFRRPITNTSIVQELITATVFWQGGLSGGVNTTTAHLKISDLPTTQSASNTAVDIQLESILGPGLAGHVRVRDGLTQKRAAIGGELVTWEVHNWYNITILVNITDQTWSLIWDGSATNATDIAFFENTDTLEWFGVVGSNGLGGGEAVDFYIDALKITTDYDEDFAGDVTAKTTFNMLQHWSMDFDWDVEDGYVTSKYANFGFIELGWDICIDDTWVEKALWARINITAGAVPKQIERYKNIWVKNQNWVEFNVAWYEQDSLIKTSTLYGLYEGYKIEPTPGQKDVIGWHWDLWFNKMDASTWIGGRINTEWFGMSDKSIPWIVWTSNWKPMVSDETESTVFIRLRDGDSNIKSAKLVTLVRPWVRVTRTKDYTFHYEIKNIQALDFITATDTMSGVDTPAIRPTQIPITFSGFFGSTLGAIFATALKRLSNSISGFGLNFFTLSIDFIDNVFSALGYPALLTTIFGWMSTLFSFIPDFLDYFLTFAGNMADILGATAGDALTQLSSVITIWLGMYSTVQDLFSGVFTPGIALWNDLGISSFIQIGAILYPIYLLVMATEKGLQAVIDHITGILNLGSFFLNFILNVAELFVNLLTGLIGAIRG